MENVEEQEKEMAETLKLKYKEQLALFPNYNTSWHMIRFIRARKMNFKKVCKMLEDFFEWREREKIEEIKKLPYHTFQPLRNVHERGLYGVDKLGRPILIERLGYTDVKVLLDKQYDDMLTNYFLQMMEAFFFIILPVCSMNKQKTVGKLFTIYDMEKVNVKKMFNKDFQKLMKFFISLIQDYYPEMLGKLFIVNANFMVMAAWKIVKPWLDKKTKSKIEIHSGVPLKRISEFVDIEKLPEFLGGSCTIPLKDNHGPWDSHLKYAIENTSFLLEDRSIEYQYFYTKEERDEVENRKKKRDDLFNLPKENKQKIEIRTFNYKLDVVFKKLFR